MLWDVVWMLPRDRRSMFTQVIWNNGNRNKDKTPYKSSWWNSELHYGSVEACHHCWDFCVLSLFIWMFSQGLTMITACTGTYPVDQTRINNQSHTQLLRTVCSAMPRNIGNISMVMPLKKKCLQILTAYRSDGKGVTLGASTPRKNTDGINVLQVTCV